MNSESLPKPDNDKFQRLKPQRANAVLQSLAKIPPNALEMEQAVLGAILLEKNAITAVMDVLKPESFYSDQHRIIYETVLDLFQTSQPIDLLTVSNHLRTKGKLEQAGSAYYLAELTSRVASAANIEFHARVIAEKYLQRELIFISDRIIRDAFEDTTDVLELLDRAESDLFSLSENNLRRNYSTMKDLIVKTIRQLEVIKSKGNSITGVPSGFSQLDQMTAGFQSSDLIIIAARPAMGKTAFVLTLARNAAVRFKIPVAFFSLEMSATQLVQRLISAEAEVPQEQIRIGNLSDEEWRRITNRNNELSKANLIIDDSPSMTIMELRAKCRRLKSEKDIGMVVID
jgi:replicative DNA helicase